jgi:hypothetical protein
MIGHLARVLAGTLLAAACAFAQGTEPFPQPINTTDGVIRVNIAEFASVPDIGGEPARMMLLRDEPGARRLFVNDMRGPLYSVSYDGKTVTQYVDINAASWGVSVQSGGRERGFQSFGRCGTRSRRVAAFCGNSRGNDPIITSMANTARAAESSTSRIARLIRASFAAASTSSSRVKSLRLQGLRLL